MAPARVEARLRIASIAIACAAIAACETAQTVGGDVVYELNPFGATDLRVHAVEVRGPYLLAEISGRREQLRMIAPASEACAAVLRPEAAVRYGKSGTFGRLSGEGKSCDLAGVASLEAWRNRQPRSRGGALVPRATARFTTLHEDPQWIWLRGRFPLAARVGIAAGYDLVALIPNDAPCRALAARGEGSIEFRLAGPDPFRMPAGDAACVIAGFAVPLSAP